MAKKLTSEKAKEILRDKSVHGNPLTEKQRKFFGAIAGGAKPYKAEEGGVLRQKKQDNYGKKPNANVSNVTLPPGFKGWAYNTKGRNYSPAWGGQFAMGGSLPGATGMMYARTINPAPSNGPYAKKTKASAQNGQEMKFYQEGLDFRPKTISQDGTVIDPMGYWNPENIGNPVIIPSNEITMQGVYEPLIGVSDTGDVQYMQPGEDYMFDGNYVTEYPMAKGGISVNEADAQPIKKLNQLLNFTNYNTMAKNGKALKKAQRGDTIGTGGLPRIQIPTMEKLKGGMPSKTIKPSATPSATTATTGMSGAMPYLQAASDVFGGLQMLGQQRNALQEAIQQEKLTGVFAQAAASRPQQYFQNQYVRPEDVIFQPEQMSPSYGVGTNILAQDGTVIRNNIGGTPTEIQNIYNPGTMYTDLGYEPLNDSNKVKAFKKGGKIKQAKLGNQNWMQDTAFGKAMMNQGGSDILQSITGAITGEPDAGSKIGKGIGTAAGTLLGGPVGGIIGGALGEVAGDIFDPTEDKIRQAKRLTNRNVGNIVGQTTGLDIQSMNRAIMQDGGETSPYKWVSHTWQPQVITTFGEYKVKDLLKPPKDADMLRAGGHLKEYTPPSAAAMSTERPAMQMGGELQTHWGGYAEPMSYNPFLPEGGETIMFRGQSHDESDGKGNTGIGITYGDNPVEVERGEPAVKLQDGTSGESNLTVFGNIKITNAFADMLADSKAKGKKFKTYVADLSKQENKQNKLIDKSIDQLDSLDVQSSFDKLALGTLQANLEGANAKLKDLADKKINAAALQNAINDTKEEELLDVTDDGDVLARKGASIPKAQTGLTEQLLLNPQSLYSASQLIPKTSGREFSRGRANAAAAVRDSVSSQRMVDSTDDIYVNRPTSGINPTDYEYLNKLYNEAKAQGRGDKVALFQKEFSRIAPDIATQVLSEYDVTAYGKAKGFPKTDVRSNIDEIFGPRTERYKALLDANFRSRPETGGLPSSLRKLPPITLPKPSPTPTEAKKADVIPPVKTDLNIASFLNQALQYLRPSDIESLDPNQLIGEMYALSQNQVEPVYAQKYIPELSTPVDISLQDILNENQAAYNATQRLVGYNPSALASLNAQKYAANQRVLGEQFRLNQAEKQRVYSENRNLLNQAKLQNLQILERQADKQATALSKTKATTQAALNSIASKYAQNKLDNRTLAVYENMYNYRYDPNFRLQNMQMAQFNIPTVGSTTQTKTAKGGKSVKKLNLNSSVVKALKNI